MFNTHQNNIPQIVATIKAFGKCYFHGDGNLYSEQEDSEFRQNFSNPKSEYSQYRILFTKEDDVPSNVEDLNKRLMESRSKEIVNSRTQTASTSIKTVKVEQPLIKKEAEQTDDEKLADLIAKEESGKKNTAKK